MYQRLVYLKLFDVLFRMQTDTELERLRSDSRESYERENRNMREARDIALQDRDQVMTLTIITIKATVRLPTFFAHGHSSEKIRKKWFKV